MLWELLFPPQVLQAAEPGVGLGPLGPQGGTSKASLSFSFLNCHTVGWDLHGLYLAPPTCLDVAFSLYP